jgi:hypothetical protein
MDAGNRYDTFDPESEVPRMDDTLTLPLDLTDYVLRPPVVDYSTGDRPVVWSDGEDSLAVARGVLIGLACTVPFWVIVALIAL